MSDFEKLGAFYLGRERDLASGEATENLLLYDSRDLTTHGVIVGMTGSGKTGLAISLLEEAAIDGVPAIAIDPKGDLGNLMLTFPQLQPSDFRPWVDEGEAQRKGLTPDQFAEQTAQTWQKGLADWGQDGARLERFKNSVDVAIYTPGSSAGIPLSVLKSLAAPPQALLDDRDALRERVMASVSGLLTMLGIEADPVRSREHILVSNLVERAWSEGRDLDLAALIREIQSPPIERVGVLDMESFYPSKERSDLAMQMNNLLASPGFAAWMEGEPMDVQRLLWTPEGKPRLSIISIAHLGDAERMFLVTLLLNEVVAWMRGQSGTSSLRALLYMDEVFGYLPPVANPPSKIPMLTLYKQARAFGLGVVVATQNPVDLDYKGLANAGTWFLGRLQTERDKARVMEGLEGASAAAGKAFDQARYDELLARLGSRVFLMNNVNDDVPVLFQTRWALSYLRGPLTRTQIQTLMADRKSTVPAGTEAAAVESRPAQLPTASSADEIQRPLLPPEIPETFLAWRGSPVEGETLRYQPALLASARLHYVDAKAGVDTWELATLLAPVPGNDGPPDWEHARALDSDRLELEAAPDERAAFDSLPGAATRTRSYKSWSGALEETLYRARSLKVSTHSETGLTAAPNESDGDLSVRVHQRLRELRDAEVDKLRDRYAPKIQQLVDREQRAQQKLQREADEYEQQKMHSMLSVGASLLGAIFGGGRRRTPSATQINRAASTLGRAGRAWSEREDIDAAEETVEQVQQRRAELELELEREVAEVTARFAPEAMTLETREIRPRKSDISVERLSLAWTPWWVLPGGESRPAFE
jgi:hypothetical protein